MGEKEQRDRPGLATRVPVPRADVEILERHRAGTPWILRSRDGIGFAEVDDHELALWRLLDGRRTLQQLALHSLTWQQPASLDWLGATVAKFAQGRLLTGDWPGEGRRHSRLLVRFGGPFSPSGFETAARWLGTLLFLVLGTPSLAVTALCFFVKPELSLMPFGASPWSFIGWVLLTLTVVEGTRALAYVSLSRPLEAVGIGLSWGLPVLTFDVPVLSPIEHRRPALWGLGSLFLLGGLAGLSSVAGGGSPLADQFFAVVMVLLVLDLGPIFRGDGQFLTVVWTRDLDIQRRVLSFVARRFVPKLLAREDFEPEENRMAVIGAGMAIWAAVALKVGTLVFKSSLGGFAAAMGVTASLPAAVATGLILLAGIGTLLWSLTRLLVTPFKVLASSGLRGEPVARLMFPLALVGSLLAAFPSPGAVAGSYVFFTLVVLGLLWEQLRAIPGARLGRGFFYLWCGILAHLLANVPRILQSLEAFDVTYLPGAWFGVLDLVMPFGLGAFGVLSLLEAARSRLSFARCLVAALPIGAGCLLAARAPTSASGVLAVMAGLAPAGSFLVFADRWNTPMHNFWRPFVLAALFLAVAGWLGPDPVSGVGLSFHFQLAAMVLSAGALLASRAMFGVGLPVKARPGAQRTAASPVEALWDGGAHVLSCVVATASFFQGESRTARIVESFNAALSKHPKYPLSLKDGKLQPLSAELPKLEDLAESLYSGLRFLKLEIASSAGVNFFDRSVAASAEALYWSEWELVHQYLLTGGDRRAAQARLREELGRVPLFRHLSAAQLEDLVGVLQHHRFSPGEVLIQQGEPGYRFFVVSRGRLSVIQEDRMGYQRKLASLGPRDCFGETALLEGGIRTATVVAETEVEVISLNKEGFDKFLPDRENVTALIRHGSFLLRLPLFSRLPSTVLSDLASRLSVEEHAKGTAVAPSQRPLESLLLVRDGSLVSGVERLDPGAVFGQPALVDRFVPANTVVAPDGASVLRLPVAAIVDAIGGWLNGFTALDELAWRHSSGGWQA